MTSWFDKGRPALFEALSNVCKQIDADLLNELQKQPVPPQESSATEDEPRVDFSVVDKLTEENKRLREELSALRNENVPASTAAESALRAENESAIPSTDNTKDKDWKSEYAKIALRYNALNANFKIAKDALQKRKEERDRWIAHADSLEEHIRKAEADFQISILKEVKSGQPSAQKLRQPASSAKTPLSIPNLPTEPPVGQIMPPLPPPTSQGKKIYHNGPVFHSESTEGDSDELEKEHELPALSKQSEGSVMVKQEPSSDGPVVVSERCVQKRKSAPDADMPQPCRVKTDQSDNSSPITAIPWINSSQQESSIDLGDTTSHMMTPRKRKVTEEPERFDVRPDSDASITRTPSSSSPPMRTGPRTSRVDHSTSALTPVSINRQLTRAVKEKPKLTDSVEPRLARRIASLAEDGRGRGRAATANTSAQTPGTKGRLSALLNENLAEDESPLARTVRRKELAPVSVYMPVPSRRELPFEKLRNKEKGKEKAEEETGLASPRVENTRTPVQPASEPRSYRKRQIPTLRKKPVSQLRLEDFKINPQANHGHDFAFSEVVRDKEERACLPGCTDIHCCGAQFRALAESMRPNPPLTPTQQQEEQKLLEEYLGDYSIRLAGMSRTERDELWLVAKTEELANKYGKHRHRFSRMRSPPGFWNADFPSTQELEADRVEASKRERAAIQMRYREAMKTGGKWIFRDE